MRLALLLFAWLLAGCSTLRLDIGESLDREMCGSFEVGTTKRADVLRALGPPTRIAAHEKGVAMLYESVRLKEEQFGFGLSFIGTLFQQPWLQYFKISLGDSGAKREAALFVFDPEANLLGVAVATWGEDFGTAGGIQIIAAVDQVVDSDSLRVVPQELQWGALLLETPPEALNQAHLADFELLGTPGGAGQRSLEQLGENAPR